MLNTFGLLIGRLLFSYIASFLLIFVFKRFRYREATRTLHGRYGIALILILFTLPAMVHMGNRL